MLENEKIHINFWESIGMDNNIWKLVQKHAGEKFKTVSGVEFDYHIENDYIQLHHVNYRLSKRDIEKAFGIENPTVSLLKQKGIVGPSYVFGIITDPRIKAKDAIPESLRDKIKKYIEILKSKVRNPQRVTENNKDLSKKTFSLMGYEFKFIQQIIPERNPDGSVKKYYPQKSYNNIKNLPILKNGNGAFCRFQIDVKDVPGVYLWVVNNEVIYIGETARLRMRFNTGYGNISPRNCFAGGQSTNCKMNKVAMSCFENGEPVNLYFLETTDYKRIELELLC